MKTLLSLAFLLIATLPAKAQTLEAKPITELVQKIKSTKFEYKGSAIIFGFFSIQSCLYVSEDIAIFKNYCYPVKDYPARGFTVFSREHGMIDFYQEQFFDVLKRDITITQFPEILAPYLTTPFPRATVQSMSDLIEKMYFKYYPACWSTNLSANHEPEAACLHAPHVVNFQEWAEETQSILLDEPAWHDLMKTIEQSL